ncbi:MAG: hypothetical protein KC535_01160 [Nanoarchaeota archaeon]|nr:hypothetical protein [Nanoarchaeota archaeon]
MTHIFVSITENMVDQTNYASQSYRRPALTQEEIDTAKHVAAHVGFPVELFSSKDSENMAYRVKLANEHPLTAPEPHRIHGLYSIK